MPGLTAVEAGSILGDPSFRLQCLAFALGLGLSFTFGLALALMFLNHQNSVGLSLLKVQLSSSQHTKHLGQWLVNLVHIIV